MKKGLMLLSILVTSVMCNAYADDTAIQKTLSHLGIEKAEVQPSPIAGLKTVLTEREIMYISEDGKHILQAPLYDVTGKEPVNVTNQLLSTKLEALKDQMIIYKAANEKKVVTVFTDITCGYCHKLHQQMKEYNDLGITVRYLAFPRQGLGSQTAKDMQSVWCAADRAKAFDASVKGDAVSPATCETDISKHYTLGIQYGIAGTPAIILQNGTLIPGYQGAKELATILGIDKATAKLGIDKATAK